MSIYTRTGDTGMTSLFGGKRVLKCEELVDVYGSMDELNSWVGLVSAKLKVKSEKLFLDSIQKDLFTIGSVLARWKGDIGFIDARVKEMEERIDEMEKALPELRNFILPGGSILGAQTHIARSICRRVERQLVALVNNKKSAPIESVSVISKQEEEYKMIIKYINRLSDLFFMLARFINKEEHIEEVLWSGIKNSST